MYIALTTLILSIVGIFILFVLKLRMVHSGADGKILNRINHTAAPLYRLARESFWWWHRTLRFAVRHVKHDALIGFRTVLRASSSLIRRASRNFRKFMHEKNGTYKKGAVSFFLRSIASDKDDTSPGIRSRKDND